MAHPLDGINLKITRAREHFVEVNEAMKAFAEENPYHIVREFDSNLGENIFRVDEPPVEVPRVFGIIVGEMVYNYRSALDHLINRLVEANDGKTTKSTSFPFVTNRKNWASARGSKLAGMSCAHVALIKGEQPCFAKNPYRARFLRYLEDIWNADKHRDVILVASGIIGHLLDAPFPPPPVSEVFFHNGAVVKDTIVCRIPGPDMDMNLRILPDIAFGQGGPAAGVLVSNFYNMIDYVVPEIVEFCHLD